MRILSTILLLLLALSVDAQYLHTPSQIETIKRESSIKYRLDSIAPTVEKSPSKVLVSSFEYLLGDTSPVDLPNTNLSKKDIKALKKANHFFSIEKFDQAIVYYQKSETLRKMPTIRFRTAYSFQKIEQAQEAIPIYNSLLAADSSNSFLYFQLANCYVQLEDYKMACHKITLAHLYNRNNTAYLDTLSNIYHLRNWKFRNLDFNPEYALEKNESEVKITAVSTPWIAYASCKAIWTFEPGYDKKMKFISSEDLRVIEEKECLLNALVAFELLDKPDKINFPGLYTLSSALPDKRVNDFIMYEISLRSYPEISSQLSQERIAQLVDYVYTYRVKAVEVSQ